MSLTETPPHSRGRLRAALGKTALKAAFGAAVAIGVLGAGQAQAVVVNVNGQNWNVTTFTGSYNDNISKFNTPANGGVMPWWTGSLPSSSLARQFAIAVGLSLGTANPTEYSNGGPFFPYTLGGGSIFSCFWRQTLQDRCGFGSELTSNYTWAQAELVPAPGPLPALGAAAAFGFSRKLRKRINAGTNPASST